MSVGQECRVHVRDLRGVVGFVGASKIIFAVLWNRPKHELSEQIDGKLDPRNTIISVL